MALRFFLPHPNLVLSFLAFRNTAEGSGEHSSWIVLGKVPREQEHEEKEPFWAKVESVRAQKLSEAWKRVRKV